MILYQYHCDIYMYIVYFDQILPFKHTHTQNTHIHIYREIERGREKEKELLKNWLLRLQRLESLKFIGWTSKFRSEFMLQS
jgi:hypothetical protein